MERPNSVLMTVEYFNRVVFHVVYPYFGVEGTERQHRQARVPMHTSDEALGRIHPREWLMSCHVVDYHSATVEANSHENSCRAELDAS